MLQCPHCGRELTILPSDVVLACTCIGAQQAEVVRRQSASLWTVERDKVLAAERLKKRR